MEKELFLSGYCRVLDASRMVEVILQDGALEEADCCYPDCVHASNCTIAQAIREQLEKAAEV